MTSGGDLVRYQVAVFAPISGALTYEGPAGLVRGQKVTVPLGRRQCEGVILGPSSKDPKESLQLKVISSSESPYPILPEKHVAWAEWLASYYLHDIGMVMALFYPPLSRQAKPRKSPVNSTKKSNSRRLFDEIKLLPRPELTAQQSKVLQQISSVSGFATHLLHGVTGSGKTEVYLRLFERLIEKNQQGLFLVPEISLTPQLIDRFASRFGDRVAVMHSQLTEREKTNQWWSMVAKQKNILIGARSALFCPLPDLTLVVLDEEHEPSYKQDEKLKYHARDAAVVLGKQLGCPVILGSATPSLESWHNAQTGKYHLHSMPERIGQSVLPEVEVVDLRLIKDQNPNWLSPQLALAIESRLERREQTALFLNRRGLAQVVMCRSCGYTCECPNCDISLTLHFQSHLTCHYCDYQEILKVDCPSCKEGELQAIGIGTEQVEGELKRLYPAARVQRADRDEISSRGDLEDLIQRMENHEIDILIGTQMIAKGLDFPRLTLVGLLMADIGFHLPDFRSTERSFQLITQMAGRAGRGQDPSLGPSQVILQTYNPEHPSVIFGQRHDFLGFAEEELQVRQSLNYPPAGRLVSFRLQSLHDDLAAKAAHILRQRALHLKERHPQFAEVEVLGPVTASIHKLRGQFRHHLMLKAPQTQSLVSLAKAMIGDESWLAKGVRLIPDVDPVHLL